MATFEELAKIYAERLNASVKEQQVARFREIESEIDGLVYTGTREKLSNEDKAKIYEGIKSKLRIKTVGFSLPGRAMFECANDELMVLIDSVIRSMGGK